VISKLDVQGKEKNGKNLLYWPNDNKNLLNDSEERKKKRVMPRRGDLEVIRLHRSRRVM